MADSSMSFRKSVWAETKKNRGWYLPAFLLSGLPVAIATVWPSLTHKTVPEWLADKGLPRLTTLVIGWVAVALVIALVIIVRSYQVARRLQPKTEFDPLKRDYLIERLAEFIREASEIDRQDTLIQMTSNFTFRSKVNHFLYLHFTEGHVNRFQDRGVYALEETIGELLGDEIPKPLQAEPVKAMIAEVTPNIVQADRSGHSFVGADDNNKFFEVKGGDAALIARLRNEAVRDRKVSGVRNVRARISYIGAGGQELVSVSHGVWLRAQYNSVDFEVGDTRTLLLGVIEHEITEAQPAQTEQPSWQVAKPTGILVYDDNRDGVDSWNEAPRTSGIQAAQPIRIQVTLFSENGVIGDDFVFEFSVQENGTHKFLPITGLHRVK